MTQGPTQLFNAEMQTIRISVASRVLSLNAALVLALAAATIINGAIAFACL